MNEKEIAFIICVNDENEFKEALNYIDALNVRDTMLPCRVQMQNIKYIFIRMYF